MLKAHLPGVRKGADFLVHVDPKQLKAQGVELVGVYLKNTTRGQIDAYHKAGISVFLIHQRGYEGKGPDPVGAGKKHGLEATQQAQALGYPKDAPIVFASMGDYDNTAATLPGSVAYWNAAKSTCGFPMGAYGDYELLDRIGAQGVCNVQAAAKAWSFDWVKMRWKGLHPTAHMEQKPSRVVATQSGVWYGVAVDPLNVIKTVKLWSGDTPVAVVRVPPPTLRRTWKPWVNRNVTWLQKQLKGEGWYQGPLNGIFNKDTEASVKWMQAKIGLPATGVYDPVTAAKWQAYLTAKK
jgi:hypothetical protein